MVAYIFRAKKRIFNGWLGTADSRNTPSPPRGGPFIGCSNSMLRPGAETVRIRIAGEAARQRRCDFAAMEVIEWTRALDRLNLREQIG